MQKFIIIHPIQIAYDGIRWNTFEKLILHKALRENIGIR